MFGYVGIYKDELKVKEYNCFRSYYCGLCKALGKEFSQIVRLGLSYDFTFLLLVLSSVAGEKQRVHNEKCMIHWVQKRPVVKEDSFLHYAASMSVATAYYKLVDDVKDRFHLKSLLGLFFYRRHLKKIKKQYPNEVLCIEENIAELNRLEKDQCSDLDLASDPFAKILELLFTPTFYDFDTNTKTALSSFGYHLGRFIYLADAANDLEEDLKSGNYNPLLYHYGKENETAESFRNAHTAKIDASLTLTLSGAAKAFELIPIRKNRGLIENIVYLGLRNSKDRALKGLVK